MVSKKSPLRAAMLLLVVSLLLSFLMMNYTNMSLIGWIMILTFSSGMMIMVIYTANSTPNEKESKMKMIFIFPPILLISQKNFISIGHSKMLWFMNTPNTLMSATILTISMLSLMEKCFNPSSATKTSF